MIEFLLLFAFRSLSGAQNGAGYAKRNVLRQVITGLLVVMAMGLGVYLSAHSNYPSLCMLFTAVSVIGIMGVDFSFKEKGDIHFSENMATAGITCAALASSFWLPAMLHVFPAMILHKGLINIGGGHKFFYYGTDDPTGKTYKMLGILVWREPQWVRHALAGVSVILVIVFL